MTTTVPELVELTKQVIQSLENLNWKRIRVDEWAKGDRSIRLNYAHREQHFILHKDRREVNRVRINLDALPDGKLPSVLELVARIRG